LSSPRPIFRTSTGSASVSTPARATAQAAASQRIAEASPGGLRALTEWLVLLALAVTLFRGFAVEGYMISTGSMAPCLLGYHTRLTCPSCGFQFAHGMTPPEAPAENTRTAQAQAVGRTDSGPEVVPCPNCSRLCTAGDESERTEGDQLLVHKDAFSWRNTVRRGGPRRWEIAIFHTPDDEHMAYVKRIVGLPGEAIELNDGDVFADGKRQRKPLEAQLSTRIPVSLHDYRVTDDDPDWDSRWVSEAAGSAWSESGSRFEHRPRTARTATRTVTASEAAWDWITYRHWIRAGGATTTSVPLPSWPAGLSTPDPLLSSLEYIPAENRLACIGALSYPQWERWDTDAKDAAFQKALWELYRESHVVPLTDVSSYNSPAGAEIHPIHDLLVELTLEWHGGTGEFAIEMTDGAKEYRTELDFGRGEVRIVADDSETVRTTSFSPERNTPTVLLMSTFDQQVLVAQDGKLLCEPIAYERGNEPPAPLRRPVRFGARGVDLSVDHIGLYRDIYYTPPPATKKQPMQLQPAEYFVLGDNSSVSIDSRHWEHPGVPEAELIGKPLVVHLPSRPLRLEWGGSVRRIRVPDFSRIRYIR
jgi:signal peptidase I